MPLRVRRQLVKLGRKTSVEIISVDQFTQFARSIDRQRSEREHLLSLLTSQVEQPYRVDDFSFWLEKS